MRKKVALTAAAVAMVGTLAVGGTLAWFTDTETATNVVTTGNVDIALKEDGRAPEGEDWKEGEADPDNQYELVYDELVPGDILAKKAYIELAPDSNDAYVRAIVTLGGDLAKLVEENGIVFYDKDNNEVTGLNWEKNGDEYQAIVYSENKLSHAEGGTTTMPIFDHIKLNGYVMGNEYESYAPDEKQLTIGIVAEAIQADNFTDAMEAWKSAEVIKTNEEDGLDAGKSKAEVTVDATSVNAE